MSVSQSSVVKMLQSVSDARNLSTGAVANVTPQRVFITASEWPSVLREFKALGHDKVAQPERVHLYHTMPEANTSATEIGVTNTHDASSPVHHAIESNAVVAGEVVVSASPLIHGFGAIGALGLRVTPREVAKVMTGETVPVRAPITLRIQAVGSSDGFDAFGLLHHAYASKALGHAIELHAAEMTLSDRIALASRAAHFGCAALVIAPDRTLVSELNTIRQRPFNTVLSDSSATYVESVKCDLYRATPRMMNEGDDVAINVAESSRPKIERVVIVADDTTLGVVFDVIRQRGRTLDTRLIPASGDWADTAMAETLGELGVTLLPTGTDPLAELDGALTLTNVAFATCYRASARTCAIAACVGTPMLADVLDSAPDRDSKHSTRRKPVE